MLSWILLPACAACELACAPHVHGAAWDHACMRCMRAPCGQAGGRAHPQATSGSRAQTLAYIIRDRAGRFSLQPTHLAAPMYNITHRPRVARRRRASGSTRRRSWRSSRCRPTSRRARAALWTCCSSTRPPSRSASERQCSGERLAALRPQAAASGAARAARRAEPGPASMCRGGHTAARPLLCHPGAPASVLLPPARPLWADGAPTLQQQGARLHVAAAATLNRCRLLFP